MQRKDLVSLRDCSAEELWEFLETAKQLKIAHKSGQRSRPLAGRTLALIFQKPSLRTRVSFETGMTQLGGHAIYLAPADIKLGQRETTEDIALVLSGYVDGIMARVFEHQVMEDLARYATVPVINGLSDLEHPCQVLGDLLTIWELKHRITGLKLAWIGDGNNVLHSWLSGAPKLGLNISLACPEGLEPEAEIIEYAKAQGTQIELSHDPTEAVRGADLLYTDVWASMGEEAIAAQKKQAFQGFQINDALLALADPEARVLHCLPAHYGDEITHEVAHGPQSALWVQAENRLHAQKAIMALLMR